MRRQLDDLQRQLGTGKKSDTYAGLGLDRGLAVGLRTPVCRARRLSTTRSPMSTCASISRRPRSAGSPTSDATVKSAAFQCAEHRQQRHRRSRSRPPIPSSSEILGLLNTQAGDRYLFSGRAADQPAVDTPRPHHERRRRARRLQADRVGAQAGRSRRQRPRPAGDHRRRPRPRCRWPRTRVLAVRLQARRRQLDADRRDRDRPGRRAAGDVGRSRRGQSECRRDRPVPLHAAGRHEREHHADRDDLGHARRRTSSPSARRRPRPRPICRPR